MRSEMLSQALVKQLRMLEAQLLMELHKLEVCVEAISIVSSTNSFVGAVVGAGQRVGEAASGAASE